MTAKPQRQTVATGTFFQNIIFPGMMTSSFEKYLSNIYYCRDASDNV